MVPSCLSSSTSLGFIGMTSSFHRAANTTGHSKPLAACMVLTHTPRFVFRSLPGLRVFRLVIVGVLDPWGSKATWRKKSWICIRPAPQHAATLSRTF